MLDVLLRVGGGDVGQRDRPLGRAAHHPPGVLVDALDAHALGGGAVHDEALLDRLGVAGALHQVGQQAGEARQALAGDRRDDHPRLVVGATVGPPGDVEVGAAVDEVGPGADEQPRPLEQRGPVAAQLVEQHPELLVGRTLGHGREVEQDGQHPGALDVAQELVAEAATLAGALDQAGDVGHHVLGGGVEPDHAEVGLEGGEGIVGDAWLGRRDAGDQRALAHVGEPHQGDVGHELQLEVEPALLAGLALLGERRRAALVREELGVAAPTLAALRAEPAVAGVDQVGQQVALEVVDHGAFGDVDLEVGAGVAVALLAHAVHAAGGTAVRVVAERQQRGHVAVGDEPDVAAVTAVATVGAAAGHVRLTPERDAAGAAVTAPNVQLCFVDEPGHDRSG